MQRNVRRTRKNRTNPIAAVVLATLIVIAAIGLVAHAVGYRYISTEGVKYTGWVKEGQPVDGTVKYSNGVSGKLTKEPDSPLGKIEYNNGDVYEGELKGSLRHGKGTMSYNDTGEVYAGDFVDDARTGFAECTNADGSGYVGEVVDGKKEGVGKHIYADGSYYYGEYKNDMRNGAGEQHYADGSYYYGTYVDDKRQGAGIVKVNLENGMIYEGYCKNVFANGDVYEGDYLNDRKNGKGKYAWASGQSYEGDFVNDLMHGTGTYDFGNGRNPYTGKFENGQIAATETVTSNVTDSEAAAQ